MNVILCEDVDNLGTMGQTVKVKPGYARNYLMPRKLAVQADSASAKQIDHELKIIKKREEKKRASMRDVAKKIEGITVELKVRAGENEKIFGSVTAGHIAEQLQALGHQVDRKQVQLAEPIKSLGTFSVPVRLFSGVEANVKVVVQGIEEKPAAPAAPPAGATIPQEIEEDEAE